MNHKNKDTKQHANYQELLYHNLRQNLNKIGQEMNHSNAAEQPVKQAKPKIPKPKVSHPSKVNRHHKKPTQKPVNPNHRKPVKNKITGHVHHRKSNVKRHRNSHVKKGNHKVSGWLDIILWITTVIIILAALYGIYMAFLNV